ncbi:MAG: hypothetical protein OEW19_03880 [Acidobacteriota bacterium]|nr:hypothetical protein [Acidobacteriota bacterium]
MVTVVDREQVLVARAIARLRAGIVAIVAGMVGGVALAAATLWLVIKGGPNVGQHLGLLRAYYPGYAVTWPGALVGFVYGALTGAILGWCVAWLYNVLAARRSGGR